MYNVSQLCRRSAISFTLAAAVFSAPLVTLSGCAGSAKSESTGEYVDDAATTAKVKTAIANELGVSSTTEVSVETFKGVVQISGFVDNADERLRVERAARSVSGVTEVQNRISVK